MPQLFIGLMSGTSLDGIDAALVDFSTPQPDIIATHEHPLPEDIKADILSAFNHWQSVSLDNIGELDQQFAQLSAQACIQLCDKAGIPSEQITAIGSHGITLRHSPDLKYPFTWQIGDPNVIAEHTGITTVADFRRRDMAAGGQGAPLLPGFHQAQFRSHDENRAILNLGGIANFTLLPRDSSSPVLGFDSGPANGLMDAWIQYRQQQPFDLDGAWARTGTPDKELLSAMLKDSYFAKDIPKSTGREYFNLDWIQQHAHNQSPETIQATLAELTAQSAVDALQRHAPDTQRVIVCGGGAYNRYLLERIRSLLDCSLDNSQDHGIPPEWVEATGFAWLARQTLNKNAGNIATVTGASGPRILGGIYFA